MTEFEKNRFSIFFIFLKYMIHGMKNGLVGRLLRELRELLPIPANDPYFVLTLGKLYKTSFSDVLNVLLSFMCPMNMFTLTKLSEITAHHSETRPV